MVLVSGRLRLREQFYSKILIHIHIAAINVTIGIAKTSKKATTIFIPELVRLLINIDVVQIAQKMETKISMIEFLLFFSAISGGILYVSSREISFLRLYGSKSLHS